MSLYGINAYTSSSYYGNLLKASNNSSLVNSMLGSTNKNSSLTSSMLGTNSKKNSNDLSSMLSSALQTDSNDLYSIARKADLVRSRDYKNELTAAFREYFYGKPDTDTAEGTDTEAAEGTESGTEKVSSVSLADSTKALSGAASKLAEGGTVYSDQELRLSTVKDYVNSYNDTLDALAESDNTKALQKGTSLVNTTNAYSRTLKRIGITVGSDNRLSLDEDKLGEAADTTLKSLFSGNYSLANKVATNANAINRTANLENQLTYNSKGTATDLSNMLSAYSMFSSTV